jgi:hypothetical protein
VKYRKFHNFVARGQFQIVCSNTLWVIFLRSNEIQDQAMRAASNSRI